jgi:alpha-methylacyl-CoA racemase
MGPLAGIRIVEMAAIGPVPFAGMMLADMGADVIRVDRTADAGLGIEVETKYEFMARGKKSIAADLKQAAGLDVVRRLIADADGLIEGFRPGVMERLGLGPDECLKSNPRLVFGRCSGWGDKGPLAPTAAHDLNYLGLSGCLAAMGLKGAPTPPLNLIGDFGGAAMSLVVGVLAGLLAAKTTGKGQVASTNISDATLGLMPMIYGLYAAGRWSINRGENLLDGGAPFYRTYETKDGRYIAVGAIEQKFFTELLKKLNLLDQVDIKRQNDRATWPGVTALFEKTFLQKTRDEWSALFAGSDACVTPVLDLSEVPKHPQQIAAGAFVEIGGVQQPAPCPRFSVTAQAPQGGAPEIGADTGDVLRRLGYAEAELTSLFNAGAVAAAKLA